jgi:tetratricopeptide (TPR) repeat protein
MPRTSTTDRPFTVFVLCAVLAICAGCRQSTETPAITPSDVGLVTFTRDIAPIVFARCASCHHPGEAAPFSLLTYDDVRRRGRQIVEVTQKRLMPPWLPTEGEGHFVHARRLSDRELQALASWVEAGMPRGDESQLPTTPEFASGWQTGQPDLVLESPAYRLDSQERDVFRNFVVPVGLDAPRWVESIELRAENPRVTHHARLGVDSFNDSVRRNAEDGQPGYPGMAWAQDPDGQLVVWAPGMTAMGGQPGVAWRLFPKSYLVLHTHMQPSGKPEIVKFQIGIHFAKDAPTQHPVMMRIGSCNIDIPAGAAHHEVHDEYILPIDVDVHTIFPHAHSLCRQLSVVAVRPDGSREPLITIDRFDENWHDCYRFEHAMRLTRGTRLISTFAYDNTADNPRNRNHPPRRVVYGSNASDEMADVYLQVTAVRPDQRASLMEHYKRYDLASQITGYRRSLELDPNNALVEEALATCYVGNHQPREAVSILESRLKAGPPAVFPVVSLGMALLAAGEGTRAEEEQRKALAIDDQYALAWFGLGKSLVAQNKSEAAGEAFHRALDLAPGLSDACLASADLLIRGGQLDEAKRACEAAVASNPDIPEVYLKLAEITARQRRYDDSLDYCAEARRLAPYTHPPKVLLAVNCFQSGDQEKARTLLAEARTEFPDHPIPPLLLGQLARRENRPDAARQFFTEAASRPLPDNWPESHRQRFLVLLHSERLQLAETLQDLDLARDALSHWIEVDPTNAQLQRMFEQLRQYH